MLSCPFYIATAEFLPLYIPNEEEKQDASLYAANVQKVIADAGGLEISKLTSNEKIPFEAYCNGTGQLPGWDYKNNKEL
eukprot:gnl/Chilomastix_caulleri/2861.p1 GENE.gnl/Chilomastix_caulleri/2861~~gnl/Chilomastix_caulleri/2861.p1  ORF type:complete len:79 (+),score=13.96 gnl/Chilomastix_caulleri/2861:253-489(+)